LLRAVFLALLWAVPDNAGRRHGPDGYVACPDGFVMAQFEKIVHMSKKIAPVARQK
jgi:hypothetical protein